MTESTIYSMKQACKKTNLTYDTLKFYCNEGLVPNVKRDKNNYRIFDDRDIAWINGLNCLKNCGMGIAEMKYYMNLCLQGESTIPERKKILDLKLAQLHNKIDEINESINYINNKQQYYDDVLSGKIIYTSNLISTKESN